MKRCLTSFVIPVALLVFASGVGASVSEPRSAHNGPITLFSRRLPVSSIDEIADRKSTTIWRCPGPINGFCGEPVSFDWAPDGRRLALTLTEIGGKSGYAGSLHIVDVVSGRDLQIPGGAPPTILSSSWPAYRARLMRRLGCWAPSELDWSPEGTKLAYRCGSGADVMERAHINVITLAGSGFATLSTPTPAYYPSWSPDGRRIAYSTGLRAGRRSSIYVAALDGSHRRLVAKHAAAPAWSPDGRTIGYEARCGVRFVTPSGRDVTPPGYASRCAVLGGTGPPSWSPDGSLLDIETRRGIFEMRVDGSHLHLVAHRRSTSHYGQEPGRPSRQPLP